MPLPAATWMDVRIEALSGIKRWFVSAFALLAMATGTAPAMSPSAVPLTDLVRRDWSVADAVPPFVQELAIDGDGFLWMMGSTGLYRFDGASFNVVHEHHGVALPSSPPRDLTPGPDGTIWISYGEGRIAVLGADGAKVIDSSDGLPATATMGHIAFGATGEVWASSSEGLFFSEHGRWREMESQYTTGRLIGPTLIDSQRRVWIVASHGLFVLMPETGAIEPIYLGNSLGATFAESPDGTVWLARYAQDSVCRMRNATIGDCSVVPDVIDIVFDREGTLWGNSASILLRIQRAQERLAVPGVDAATLIETLLLDTNTVLMDDHDQVWVAGDNNLTRFRPSLVAAAATPSGAIAAASGDQAWVASFGRGLSRIGKLSHASADADLRAVRSEDGAIYLERGLQNHRWQSDPVSFRDLPLAEIEDRTIVLNRFAEAGTRLVRVDRDRSGGVWVAAVGPARLVHSADGTRFTEVTLPSLDDAALVRGVAVDAKGITWLAVNRNKQAPLYALEQGVWKPKSANGMEANAFMLDLQGQPWIGTSGGRIARLAADGWVTIGGENAATGGITALAASADARWVGGSLGIAAIVDDVLRPLQLATAPDVRGVTGLVADKEGNLWINSADGMLRVVREELRQALATPGYRAAVARVDRFDGVKGYGIQNGPFPTLAHSDGRVWFTTSGGLYTIAAETLKPAAAPRSHITAVIVDDEQRALTGDALTLPPRTQRITMRFTAPDLRSAERIQFRYRLQPFEQQWQNGGLRREAFYTNLDPGSYTFEVQASNDHGEWLGDVARLGVQLQPAFIQTRTFVALCVVAMMLLLGAIYALRMRQLAARLVAEGNVRHAERERIARELHDTLLQGMQSLILRLDALMRRNADTALKEQVTLVLDEAEAMLEEGRDRVRQLNEKVQTRVSFVDALSQMGMRLAQSHSCRFEIAVAGTPITLAAEIEDELLRLLQEAVSNAARHSRCQTVRAEVTYDDAGIQVVISDDGRGIEPTVLEHGKPGHFGLEGMRQRAVLLGASLDIRNAPQGGVRVTVQVPASAHPRARIAARR